MFHVGLHTSQNQAGQRYACAPEMFRGFWTIGWFWMVLVSTRVLNLQNHMNPQRMRREHLSRAAAACYWSLGTKRCRIAALLCKLLASHCFDCFDLCI